MCVPMYWRMTAPCLQHPDCASRRVFSNVQCWEEPFGSYFIAENDYFGTVRDLHRNSNLQHNLLVRRRA
jgi:hypothetical protein